MKTFWWYVGFVWGKLKHARWRFHLWSRNNVERHFRDGVNAGWGELED
jgi:hypothetical protein